MQVTVILVVLLVNHASETVHVMPEIILLLLWKMTMDPVYLRVVSEVNHLWFLRP